MISKPHARQLCYPMRGRVISTIILVKEASKTHSLLQNSSIRYHKRSLKQPPVLFGNMTCECFWEYKVNSWQRLTYLSLENKSKVMVNFPNPLDDSITFLLAGLIPIEETTPHLE